MDITKLNKHVLGCIRLHLGAKDENDTSRDNEIARMGQFEMFNSFLLWNGIIGYTSTILNAIDNIRGAVDKK